MSQSLVYNAICTRRDVHLQTCPFRASVFGSDDKTPAFAMPPTVRPKSAPKLKLAGTGEAGSPPKMSNRRSTTSQRARKSSTSTKATPSTPKKAPPAAAIPQEAVDVVSVKSFIDELLAPRKALIGLTRAKMEQTVQRLHELGDKGVTIESTAEGAVKGAPAPAAPKPVTGAERKVAVGVWQEICREHLAEMASSLEGALSNESKLHELFNRIDLDGGGTLDLSEIRAAITLAGKDLSSEQIDLMLRTADEDHNGGIDYEEVRGTRSICAERPRRDSISINQIWLVLRSTIFFDLSRCDPVCLCAEGRHQEAGGGQGDHTLVPQGETGPRRCARHERARRRNKRDRRGGQDDDFDRGVTPATPRTCT